MQKPGRIQKPLLFESVTNLALYTVLNSNANVNKAMAEERKLACAYDTHTEA
jgi:hypothetical protein